jgi:aspartyl-tRNA(Asn)/glutamyl-tRNA(Gln) amidotransferase subunit A
VTAPDLVQAFRVRRELTDAVNGVLDHYDALLTASALIPAPRFDAPPLPARSIGPMQTISFNVTGHPAMSVPTGLAAGMPIGVQVVGRPFDEACVLRVGRAVELLSGWETIPSP